MTRKCSATSCQTRFWRLRGANVGKGPRVPLRLDFAQGQKPAPWCQLTKDDAVPSGCPTHIGETPTARLDVMNNRLDAMVQAVKTLRPNLGTFYASVSDEQKAQFNSMGQQNATPQESTTGGQQK